MRVTARSAGLLSACLALLVLDAGIPAQAG
jgi:hypothetical protein